MRDEAIAGYFGGDPSRQAVSQNHRFNFAVSEHMLTT